MNLRNSALALGEPHETSSAAMRDLLHLFKIVLKHITKEENSPILHLTLMFLLN